MPREGGREGVGEKKSLSSCCSIQLTLTTTAACRAHTHTPAPTDSTSLQAPSPPAPMAEQERIAIEVLDMLAPASRAQTKRAVDLARLLLDECTRLLDLYKERESFLADHTPEEGRIVSLSTDAQEASIERQVQLLHSALRQCLGLLHCLILKEEEEMGELEGEYETLRKNVRSRLEHLLHSTRVLVEADGATVETTPDHQCNEEVDGMMGSFAVKMWTHRVLLELIHWADHASQTLHVLHTQKAGTGEA